MSATRSAELVPIPFQLLGRRPSLPSGPDWLFERKFDGYRAQIVSVGGDVRVFTRGGQDWTHRVPHIVEAAATLGSDFILDGEVCATTGDGRTDLSWFSDTNSHGATVIYHAFDLLRRGHEDSCRLPLLSRKVQLEQLLSGADQHALRTVAFVLGNGERLQAETRSLKHEGIVAKRAAAAYQPGRRSDDWLKFKNRRTGTFRVAGWQLTAGGYLSSLLLATTDDSVRYCGRVGTGFSSKERMTLPSSLPKTGRCPLPTAPSPAVCYLVTWSDLSATVEIEYLEMSSAGVLREPSFRCFREAI